MVSTADFERSVHRSDLRTRTLTALASLGEAYPRQLAQAARIDSWRLHAVLHGRPPDYAVAFALVVLGLVEERMTPRGRLLRITERGRKKARQLTSRWARRAANREARRTERQGPRAWPRASSEVGAAVTTPEVIPTSSYTWRL